MTSSNFFQKMTTMILTIKKILLNVVSVGAGLLCVAGVATADDSPHQFSANVSLVSDYLYRGISQTSEDPAVQGGFEYAHAPFRVLCGHPGPPMSISPRALRSMSMAVSQASCPAA